ncbi:hypothetical protein [Carnimonas bestiolae]|uniref:hypothetical protein n=1 Tax=Carnimonas bestiolae TaxID=3402172 RepID=UPI003EDC4418
MKSIAEHLRDVLTEEGMTYAWRGRPDELLEAYQRTGGKVSHPFNRLDAVISAARKSPLFEPHGYIKCCDCHGVRETYHRVYVLKGCSPQDEIEARR